MTTNKSHLDLATACLWAGLLEAVYIAGRLLHLIT